MLASKDRAKALLKTHRALLVYSYLHLEV